jgi:hypothetical protein
MPFGYNRFVELMAETLEPLAAFMQGRCVKSDGIAFVDSTPLCVCENIRIPRHKTFAGVAGRGKSSTGWFFGFKLHLVVNERGGLVSFCLTRGNVDDRKLGPTLAKGLIGKLFGDRGYISKKLTALLAEQNVDLITTAQKNMKPRVLAAFDKLVLRKRSLIETINDQLKNIFVLEHSRHRSLVTMSSIHWPAWSLIRTKKKSLLWICSAKICCLYSSKAYVELRLNYCMELLPRYVARFCGFVRYAQGNVRGYCRCDFPDCLR